MLYKTATRAEEPLSLKIEDLNAEFQRALAPPRGHAIDYVHQATAPPAISRRDREPRRRPLPVPNGRGG